MQQHATRDTSIPNSAAATSTAPKCAASQPAMKCGPASLRSHQSSAKRPACSSVSQPLAISERNRLSTAGAWQVKHGRVDCKHGGRAATNKEPARTVPVLGDSPKTYYSDPVAVRQNPVAQDPVPGRDESTATDAGAGADRHSSAAANDPRATYVLHVVVSLDPRTAVVLWAHNPVEERGTDETPDEGAYDKPVTTLNTNWLAGPAKRNKRTKAEPPAKPTQPTKGKGKAHGMAAKAKPAPQPGRWLDRDCNAALNMQRIGESRWRPLELCCWPQQGALPAKGKEYPGLGYKRLRDKPPKAQEQHLCKQSGTVAAVKAMHMARQTDVTTPLHPCSEVYTSLCSSHASLFALGASCGLWLQLGQLGGDMSSLCPTFGGGSRPRHRRKLLP
ncbi:hypothetical protein QJQ45_023088 [Haematococcus lacustris]|nr:hypothetical protein QJQ45_023088 [Haematococcus lacustris]